MVTEHNGQIVNDLEEFCKDYGHPAGQLFTFEITCSATTYVYENLARTVRANKVIFELNGEDLVSTRKAHEVGLVRPSGMRIAFSCRGHHDVHPHT
jgi:hypothetical protein